MVKAERNEQIVSAYLAGETGQSIGDRFGLTRERVYQIVRRDGGEGAILNSIAARGGYFSAEGLQRWLARGPRARSQKSPARDDEIYYLLTLGHTYSQVANLLGVTRNTVAGAKWRAERRAGRAA